MPDLTVDTINRLLELDETQQLSLSGDDLQGLTFTNRTPKLVVPPAPTGIGVVTLTGFVDLLESSFEGFQPGNVLIHVAAHDEVQFIARESDRYGRRQVLITAKAQKADQEFPFDQFISVEAFNIKIRSLFVDDDHAKALVALAGNIKQGNEVNQEDDGFSQRVTAKTGVGPFTTERTVNPRVTLAPFRTFREVCQPASDYIFRVKDTDKGVCCALFLADGGVWRLKAIEAVQAWLSNRLKGSGFDKADGDDVVTTDLGAIPIVA